MASQQHSAGAGACIHMYVKGVEDSAKKLKITHECQSRETIDAKHTIELKIALLKGHVEHREEGLERACIAV